jgi:Rod binding domain-containing protein
MNVPAPHNLKPFASVSPQMTGVDLASRSLRPLVDGLAGRYASAPQTQHDQMVEQTRTWVAQTFFGTLLKQMRNSPFKSELFSGGRGGEAYGGMYDQHLAEHMARGAGSKLVNSIVRRLEAQQAYRKQQGAPVENAARADNRTDARRHGERAATAGETRQPQQQQQRTHGSPASRS